MLVHNAAYRGAAITGRGDKAWRSNPTPPHHHHHHRLWDIFSGTLSFKAASGWIDEWGGQLTLMGTRIEGVDIGALRSLIFKLSRGGQERSAWTNSVARLGKMKITLTLIAEAFYFF